MKKVTTLKMALLLSVVSIASQSFALVDSTTDNQLPSMREEWQIPRDNRCPYIGEMELDSEVDYTSSIATKASYGVTNTVPVIDGYEDFIKDTDLDTMQTGGDPTNW